MMSVCPKFARPALLAAAMMLSVHLSTASAADYLVNTDTMTVTRGGVLWDFNGQLSSAGVINGKATFYLGGDLTLGAGDTLRGVGSRPVSFNVGNDMVVSQLATIDFSAFGTTAGAGGGSGGYGGLGGSGGTGGDGGAGGGVQWVRGGGAFMFFFGAAPPPVPGLSGHDGEDGLAGTPGAAGVTGYDGGLGFNNIAPAAAGGSSVYSAATGTNFGFGGQGGSASKYWPDVLPTFLGGESKDGGPGSNGYTGSTGGSGAAGGSGFGGQFMADPSNTFDLVAGNGGGGGAGGQGGDGGGGGGGGGGGAAGQGNWATVIVPPLPPSFIPGWNFAGFGGSGGPGSDGGDGGFGGTGGTGGDGGAGGGAVEFLVQGNISLNGSANATGGNGESGHSGSIGLPGYSPGEYDEAGNIAAIIPIPGVQTYPGGIIATSPFPGGIGGIGGLGQYGGDGGQGASGGAGGGGSGGTIKLVGTSVTGAGTVNLSGGFGANGGSTTDDGQAGRLLVGTNTAAVGSSAIGAMGPGAYLTGNDSTTQTGTRAPNPLIAGDPSVPTIAGLVGGAEAFGQTGLNANDIYLGADTLIDLTPQEAFAGLARVDLGPGALGDDYLGYDMLLFFEAKGTQVSNPMLGIGEEDYLVPLLSGGWSHDLLFGGSGDTPVTTMNGFDVYATLIPSDAEWFNFSVDSGGVILSAKQQVLNDGELFFVTSSPDVPVLDATWVAGSGNWSGAANWSMVFHDTGLPPTGSEDPAVPGVPSNSAAYAYNIHVDQDVTVNTDITVAVDQLNIGAGDAIDITGGQALTIERYAVRTDSGKINNDGTIMLNGSPGNIARLYVSGPGLMLDGTGTLTTTTDPANNIISGLRNGDSLTQFADHTIDASGLLGNDKLVMDNRGTILTNNQLTIDPVDSYDRSSAAFTNSGLVRAEGEGGGNTRSITLQDGFFTNEAGGTIEAVNSGELVLDAARLHNAGTIHIDSTSTLLVIDAVLTGNDIQFDSDSAGDANLSVDSGQFINGTHLLAPYMTIDGSDVMNIDGGRIGGFYDGTNFTSTQVYGSTITGGELSGEIYIGNSTLKDVTLLPDGYIEGDNGIGLAGRIDNQSGTGGAPSYNYIYAAQAMAVEDTTLAGGGAYVFDYLYGNSNDAAPTTLTISPESTVEVTYEIGHGLVTNNRGELDVYGDLAIDPAGNQGSPFVGLFNAGTISNSGGNLYFGDGIIDNTGGVIDSTYTELSGVTIVGGDLNGSVLFTGYGANNYVKGTIFHDSQYSGSYFEVDANTSVILDDVTLTQPTTIVGWDTADSTAVILKNKLNMSGIGSLEVDSVTLAFDNDFTFDGQGELDLFASGLASNSSAPINLTVGEQFAINGDTGIGSADTTYLGQDTIVFNNQGSINGHNSVFVIDPAGTMDSSSPGIVNRGSITGTEVYLQDAYVDNRGGTIGDTGGSYIYLSGTRVVGGEIDNFSLTSDTFDSNALPGNRLENVTLGGYGEVNSSDGVTLVGTIENNAEIDYYSSGFTIDGSVQLTGTGTITFSDEDTLFTGASEDDTLVNEAGHTLDFSNLYSAVNLLDGGIHFTNNGTILFNEASLDSAFSTEVLPAGAQVPDTSDPNNPDAVMTLTEDTPYLAPRTLNNTGSLQGFVLHMTDTAIRNSGTIGIEELDLSDSSLINDGGQVSSYSINMDGASTISGGTMLYPYIEVTDFSGMGPASIASVDTGQGDISAYGAVEFGGQVTNIAYLELNNASGQVPTVIVENADTAVDVDTTDIIAGVLSLSDGSFRTNSFSNGSGSPALDWTGGTFGLLQEAFVLGSTGNIGSQQLDLLTGMTLEAPMGVGVQAGATLNIGAGDLQTNAISNDGQINVGLDDTDATFDQPITGNGSLAKLGAGTVHLTGANTYAGGTTIQEGTLEVDTSENIGDAGGPITFAGGSLRVLGVDPGATAHPVVLNSSPTIDIVDPDAVFEVSGATNALPATGSFTKNGEGTLNYHASLTITRGSLTVNGGTMDMFNNYVNLPGTDGLNGASGVAGTSGYNAGPVAVTGGSLDNVNINANGGSGGNGGDGYFGNLSGRNGGNGAAGGTISISNGRLQITATLNLHGGDGGDGGDGYNAVFSYGDGGNGGNGGSGGNVYVNVGGELIFTSGSINLAGGTHGNGGYGPGTGADGQNGYDGNTGSLSLQGGTLTTYRSLLDNALTGNFVFTQGAVRFLDANFDLASSTRLNTALGNTSKTLSGGRSLQVDNTLSISPTQSLTLTTGSSLTAGTIDHTLGGSFNFLNGTLSVGTFEGNLSQLGGILGPELALGTTQITGDYNATAGTIDIELAGLIQGTGYNAVDVLGSLTLGDVTLDVSVPDAAILQTNQQYDILSIAGTRSGAFTGLDEGAVVGSFGHYDLLITYLAGDGNDVALTVKPTLDGDFNGDGYVGLDDLQPILDNWNQNVPPADPIADANGDGYIGLDDLQPILDNWNAGTAPPVNANIPEPAAISCMLLGSLTLLRREKRSVA